MNRTYLRILFLVLLLALPASYNACGLVRFTGPKGYETVAGNPFSSQASQEILFAICSVLDRCQAHVPFNTCMSGVLATNGIGGRLGLPPGVDNPYSALENAENLGTIFANATAANTCTDTINNLSCNDPNVFNAYNTLSSNPFAAVPLMVPMASCGQVFTPPVQQYACATKVFLRGNANSPNGPAVSGPGLTFSVSPSLPTGLSLDSNTGIISGTPSVVTPMTPYTLTAAGPQGTTSSVLNIRTADGYLVNDLTDAAFSGPGANCLSTNGTCNLRSAIQATVNSGSPQVVVMPAGTSLLTLGQLNITQGMDIYGDCAQGTAIDGNSAGRVIGVLNSGNTSFNSLTIQNGKLNNADGAGILIINNAVPNFTVAINNSTIQNNVITGAANWPWAAGVSAGGTAIGQQVILNVNNSTFSNNQMLNTEGSAAALAVGGNGYFAQGTITNSSFISNSSSSTFSGALEYAGLSLTVSSSLFYNNTSAGQAGVFSFTNGGVGPANFINDTFDSNSSTGLGGGGVMITSGASGNTASFTNCTFANNTGNASGVLMSVQGGNLGNNLFYGNSPTNCSSSIMTSIGGNLSDHAAGDCALTQGSDIVNTNGLLGPLQNNGGPTQTRALLPNSPAVDQGLVAGCPSNDQRGYTRHIPNSCDSGAFEHEP